MHHITIQFSRVLSGPKQDQNRKVLGATFPLLSLPDYRCDSLNFRWSDPPLFPSPLHSLRTVCSDALHQQETKQWFLAMRDGGAQARPVYRMLC